MQYFLSDFSDRCPNLYICQFKRNVSAAVSSGLPLMSFVYVGIEMIQPRKSSLEFKSFLCPDERRTPEEGRRIRRPKFYLSTNENKKEDNNLENHTQNIAHKASSKKFRRINVFDKI